MSWAAVAGAVISVGASYAAKQGQPDAPDLASSSREMSNTNAELLPIRRALEAAAKQGGKATIQNYPAHTEDRQYIQVANGSYTDKDGYAQSVWQGSSGDPLGALTSAGVIRGDVGRFISREPVSKAISKLFGGKSGGQQTRYDYIPYDPKDWEAGGKYANQPKPSDSSIITRSESIPKGPKTFDFTGFGEADANAAVAQQMAKVQLDLGAKYGEDFAKTAAEQAKLSDPEGYAARQKMDELIQGQINRTPDRSIANTLDRQIQGQLDAGSGLDAETQSMLDDAVRRAGNDRGGLDAGANFADPLTTGYQGAARKDAAMQKGLSWLTSGATPQDAAYRDTQQNMSNLSALVNGRTPQSQFASLSAPGAAPQAQVQGGAQMPGNSAAVGAQGALNTYGANIQQAQQQVSPWMMGLSGLLSAANASAANKKTV
jgi:hypothetical protein